jgi:hypothetical protein
MTDRPVFIAYLQPQPGTDGVRALKALLKTDGTREWGRFHTCSG